MRGRPSKIDKVNRNLMAKMFRLGFTDAEVSEAMGISRSTLSKWKAENPDFSDTLKKWKEEADVIVERSLYEKATGFTCTEDRIFRDNGETVVVPTVKHYPPDTTACIFWLKNRRPDEWRDKRENQLTGKDGGPIQYQNLTDEQLDAQIAALAAELGYEKKGEE